MAATFRLRKGVRFALQGQIYEVDQFIGLTAIRFININDGSVLTKDKHEILKALESKVLQVLCDSPEDRKRANKTDLSKADLSGLDSKIQDSVRRKIAYVQAVQRKKLSILNEKNLSEVIKETSTRLKDDKPPSWISVYRWVRAIKKSEDARALIPTDWQKGNYNKRKPRTFYAIVDDVINNYYLSDQKPSIMATMDVINSAIDEENSLEGCDIKLPLITYKAVYNKIKKLDPYLVAKYRHGEKFADQYYKLSEKGPRPSRILERVEMDHTKLDLFVIDEKSMLAYGRPWLTIALDVQSRCILSCVVGFAPPSAETVLACLKSAIWTKGYIKEKYPDINHEWSAAGVPETIVVDNGKEFIGSNLENACACLGVNVDYCPVQEPWYKGTVERFFGTLNTKLIHNIPGTTFSNIFEKGEYDSKKNAVITLEMLNWVITKWIVDVYHQEVHRGTGFTPASLWEKGCKEFEPRYATSLDELETLLGYTAERTVGRSGIELNNLFYSCPDIAHLRTIEAPNGKFTIKYDPSDIGHIHVFDPSKSEWITVPAVEYEYANGLSLWQHKVHEKHSRLENGKVDKRCCGKTRKPSVMRL